MYSSSWSQRCASAIQGVEADAGLARFFHWRKIENLHGIVIAYQFEIFVAKSFIYLILF
jgi:hypothetical protein